MMPITPSGTRTREISSPFGRVQRGNDLPDRIGKCGDLVQAPSHGSDAEAVQHEPVEEGGIAALAPRGLEVLAVRLDDFFSSRLQPGGHRFPGASFFASVEASASARAASRARRPI